MDYTIEDTNSIPTDIATSGKVNMTRREIMKHIGELFILRININLQGSVLDSPELMWAEPQLEPVYMAARSYLEINQRLSLLNQRLDVISDLVSNCSHDCGIPWLTRMIVANAQRANVAFTGGASGVDCHCPDCGGDFGCSD